MTKDRTSAHNKIPLKKFANRIANAVARFLDVRHPRITVVMIILKLTLRLVQEAAQRLDGQVPNWRVGDGGITKEQVILQINRYVMPRHSYLGIIVHS
jgi:hypothetical protein